MSKRKPKSEKDFDKYTVQEVINMLYTTDKGRECVKRCNALYNLFTSGFSHHEMRQFCLEKFGSSERTFYLDMRIVKYWFAQNSKNDRAEKINQSIAVRLETFKKAMAEKKLDLAHEIWCELDRFQNLYPVQKMRHEFGSSLADFLLGKKIEGVNDGDNRTAGEITEAEIVEPQIGEGDSTQATSNS